MNDHLSRNERVNAFIAAMGQEEYYRILDFATTIIKNGYAPDKTWEQVVDKLIEKEYDKQDGKLKNVGVLPSIAKIEPEDFEEK